MADLRGEDRDSGEFVFAVARSDGLWFRGNEANGASRDRWGPRAEARIYRTAKPARAMKTAEAKAHPDMGIMVAKFRLTMVEVERE